MNYRELVNLDILNEVLAGPKEEVFIDDINKYITYYETELKFLSSAFNVKYKDILSDLLERHKGNVKFNVYNVGLLDSTKEIDNVLYGMVEYFYDYEKKNPNNINKERVPYNGNAQYIENLIVFLCEQIYTNVDPTIALSIASIESASFKAKSMMKVNNVYGGMSGGNLIKYRNIDYGVLSYIRLLSRSYFGKGLTTVETIGKKYNPTYDKFGNKIANPNWVNSVNTAMVKYNGINTNITLSDLLIKDE